MEVISLSEVNEAVKVENGKLLFGSKEARGCSFIRPDSIAALYVIRVKSSDSWRFVTGLDLIGKLFWLGGVNLKVWDKGQQLSLPPAMFDTWDRVEYVLDRLGEETAGKEWAVFEEEDFDAHRDYYEQD